MKLDDRVTTFLDAIPVFNGCLMFFLCGNYLALMYKIVHESGFFFLSIGCRRRVMSQIDDFFNPDRSRGFVTRCRWTTMATRTLTWTIWASLRSGTASSADAGLRRPIKRWSRHAGLVSSFFASQFRRVDAFFWSDMPRARLRSGRGSSVGSANESVDGGFYRFFWNWTGFTFLSIDGLFFFFFLLYWARGEVLRFWLLVHFVLASLVALFHLHQRPNGIDRLSSEHWLAMKSFLPFLSMADG